MSNAVLVVSAVSPLPVDNGRRVFLRGLVRYLLDRYDEENVHFALAIHPNTPLPDLPGHFYRLPVPSAREKLWNVGAHCLAKGDLSLQEALLSSRELRGAISDLVTLLQPDVEFYDTVRIGQHRMPRRPDTRQILHLDDLYSVRYTRMLEAASAATSKIDPLGQFSDNVPGAFRQLARRPAVYRHLLRWEASRLQKRERSIVNQFDVSTLHNSTEVATLRREANSADIRLITPLAMIPERTDRAPSARPDFLFLGRLNVPHNDDAICAFLTDVMPGLVKLRPDCKLTIVGAGAGANLQELAARFAENVEILGFVEDLDPYFARATAVVAPLRFGSGVKIKVLDALIRGAPVVGTKVALEGIPAGRLSDPRSATQLRTVGDLSSVNDIAVDVTAGCIVEDDFRLWPAALTRLIDPETNAASSRAAAADGARLYSEDHIYQQYDSIFLPDSMTIDLDAPRDRLAAAVGGTSAKAVGETLRLVR